MYRKWKGLSVLGIAALIGCMAPMGTMLAAEENTVVFQETETDSVSGNTVTGGDEAIPDDNMNNGGEVNADDGVALLSVEENEPAARTAGTQESIAAPVIDIKWQGQSQKYDLGGKIDYKYVNILNQSFDCSASQSGHTVSLFYCLEEVTDITAEAKGEEQMASLSWINEQSTQVQIQFLHDGNYVLYVKAEGEDGQTTFARSGGIVMDTKAPEVTGVEEGKTYPEGTVFQIKDANLESVTINEKPVALSQDGSYQVTANGTSCVIKAKDKAGNDITCSITVSGKDPAADGNMISKAGMYSLKTGTAYKLAEGKWKVYGDNTVYQGGSSFYVETADDYVFMKY